MKTGRNQGLFMPGRPKDFGESRDIIKEIEAELNEDVIDIIKKLNA